jgi:dipeptidyl aminopeptidase/acylaminoacyl peptidase
VAGRASRAGPRPRGVSSCQSGVRPATDSVEHVRVATKPAFCCAEAEPDSKGQPTMTSHAGEIASTRVTDVNAAHRPRRQVVDPAAWLFIALVFALLIMVGPADLNSQPAAPHEHRGPARPVDSLRAFTVQDAIEITYLVNSAFWSVNHDPSVVPIISPDRKRLLVITQRGVLSSNSLESTIWVFDRQAIADFLSRRSSVRPRPKAVTTFRAVSNMSVVTDARWLEDSKRIAFLARTNHHNPQLYVADVTTRKTKRLTPGDQYVSAYDIRGKTIAYTTLLDTTEAPGRQGEFVDVTGRSLWALLWRDRALSDRDEAWLLNIPNILHVVRGGHELSRVFTMDGRPLRLFFPVLSLSPDEQSLVTVAPVHAVPKPWAIYQPWFGYEDLKLTPDNKQAVAEENNWKASQEVRVDLRNGVATSLLEAPAGRSLFFISAPTKVIWSPDSRHVLLSNTFLPISHTGDPTDSIRSAAPAVAIVDVVTREVQPITYLEQPPRNTAAERHVSDITWDPHTNDIELTYASSPDNAPIAFHETFRLGPAGWARVGTTETSRQEVEVSVHQDLDRSPVLAGQLPHAPAAVTVWDPNPQLASIALGKASLYQWHDKDGNPHSGILVLPPGYVPARRYPLVIQTHGYEPTKFFADGRYTTGSGGRALVGKGIVVLQMDQSPKYMYTPKDGPFQAEGFRSAIQQLAAAGVVDPQRVGVIGFSFTVFHVLYAITHQPELFAAASITDGNDLSYWQYLTWTDIPSAQQFAESVNGGVMPFGRDGLLKWAESAPGFNLDRVQAPLLISCLEKGTLVATWDIYGGLRTLKKPVDLMWLRKEDAPHVLVQPRQRYLSQQEAVDWFDFWLSHHEDSDRRKAEQYARWRELRNLEKEGQRTKGTSRAN